MRWLLIPVTLGVILSVGVAAVESRPEQARAGMLDAHNAVRKQDHPDLPALSWSARVTGQAQAWAATLARNGCQMRHNPALQDHGQNLFWAGQRREVTITRSAQTGEILKRDVSLSVQEITAEDVVGSWASEKQWYDDEANTCRAPRGGELRPLYANRLGRHASGGVRHERARKQTADLGLRLLPGRQH
jgi:hypothetical protein